MNSVSSVVSFSLAADSVTRPRKEVGARCVRPEIRLDTDGTPDLTTEKRDRPNAYIELPEPVRARYIRYEHVHVASPNLAISDIRVFGNAEGKPPRTPQRIEARRDRDRRNAFVKWEKVPGVIGYNIL